LTAGSPTERALSPIKFEITFVLHDWAVRNGAPPGRWHDRTRPQPPGEGDIV
jgi:hypothetical protein